jgi:1,4-alpha-glucan branching enzyme
MEEQFALTDEELFLFNQGTLCRGYQKFGAHLGRSGERSGVCFTVWAPSAKSVRVVGSFNDWRADENRMSPVGSSGVWSIFIAGITEGALYKYLIETAGGALLYKSDPFAFSSELRPGTASRVADLSRGVWQDGAWLQRRKTAPHSEQPMNIYEVHLGSWKQHDVGQPDEMTTPSDRFFTYRALAETLIPYAKDMGFTHIEFMPVMEHPFDGSWGYQVTGYYAPTSRYGTPEDFMYFINACHTAELGVILDWVPGHFCRDAHGLGRFNGAKLYEVEDHAQWGTYKFDLGRPEVRSFLLSNALFWLDIYHIDGIRVDGVTSMLYLNFGIGDKTKHRKNRLGGDEDLDAVSFIKEFNQTVSLYYPDVFTAAEESTSWPQVTRLPDQGGLGFSCKWDMGWMNDTLKYTQQDFPVRSQSHNLLTFSMMYAYSESFILPLSHDEVVHGKRSLIGRMPGNYWHQFAGLRLLALYQLCHPGAKLSFMGNEFGQFVEWRYFESLEWFLLDYDAHRQHQFFIKTLNHLYLKASPLWELDFDTRGFVWLDADNKRQSILLFKRQGKAEMDFFIIALNFLPDSYTKYKIGVPLPGRYTEILNSDDKCFGGSGKLNPGALTAQAVPMHGQNFSLEITVPPLGGTIIRPELI